MPIGETIIRNLAHISLDKLLRRKLRNKSDRPLNMNKELENLCTTNITQKIYFTVYIR